MSEQNEFNPTDLVLREVREVRRDVAEIRTVQAAQPTRADLQNYVLKEVFDIQVAELKKTDEAQEERLNTHENHIQTSTQRLFTYLGIGAGVVSAIYTVLHGIFSH